MEKYTKQRVIGKGSYGQAVVVKRKADGLLLVMKEVRLAGLKQEERREARAECHLLSRLQHPNVVQYIEHFEQRQVLYIVMEYAEKGDLDSVLKKHRKANKRGLPQDRVLHLFSQMCLAMKYLHDQKILHRDIKAANIFITKSNLVKIGDFGISTILKNTFALARTVCGTPYYFSPELCQNRPYNNKSDIWALGCVLYELCTLRHPFDGATMKQLMQRIVQGTPTPIPSTYDKELRELVASMLNKNDKVRPNIGMVINTPVMRTALESLQHDLGEATVQRQRIAPPEEVDTPIVKRVTPPPKPRSGAVSPKGVGYPRQGMDRVAKAREREVKEAEERRRVQAELQAAERAQQVKQWHQKEQQKAKQQLGMKDRAALAGVTPIHGDPTLDIKAPPPPGNRPGHRRRVSAPVSSPSKASDDSGNQVVGRRRAEASPRAAFRPPYALDNDIPPPHQPQHGRRSGQTDRSSDSREEDREIAYQQRQREKSRAINELILKQEEELNGPGSVEHWRSGANSESASNPNSRPTSQPSQPAVSPSHGSGRNPVLHGRRATAHFPDISNGSRNPSPAPSEEAELAGQSCFVDRKAVPSSTPTPPPLPPSQSEPEVSLPPSDSDDDEISSSSHTKEYKAVLNNIEGALEYKPGGDEENFGDEVDCPPALQVGIGEVGSKFILGGETLKLDIAPTAPLSQRAELLRVYLDQELGTDLFLGAYKLISDMESIDQVLPQVEGLLGKKKDLALLVAQLVYCDDQINLCQ